MKKNFYILLCLFTVGLSSCSTTYYIVRHGEKTTTPPKDPVLSEEGLKRAQKLKADLAGKGIKKIYSSNYQRTKMTAQPLADALGIQTEIYNPADQLPFVEKLKASKDNTLVVAHSNTLKQILNGLAEKEVLAKDLDESEYDNIYVVKRSKSGKPKVKAGKY
jgi:2,3-bisphosphoglycerate-dependent phosphoglycerate mutase